MEKRFFDVLDLAVMGFRCVSPTGFFLFVSGDGKKSFFFADTADDEEGISLLFSFLDNFKYL